MECECGRAIATALESAAFARRTPQTIKEPAHDECTPSLASSSPGSLIALIHFFWIHRTNSTSLGRHILAKNGSSGLSQHHVIALTGHGLDPVALFEGEMHG